jgi:hypothetical protein
MISLLARASTSAGIVKPICLAVFRLMMNSNLIDWFTDEERTKITEGNARNVFSRMFAQSKP